mmetsp:Transcript_23769/g.54574  ORF Transcript_23769/g.54574 Transcript_23769/m.54574 type:complete len:572 (+) Transcript_23769:228-1943(+)
MTSTPTTLRMTNVAARSGAPSLRRFELQADPAVSLMDAIKQKSEAAANTNDAASSKHQPRQTKQHLTQQKALTMDTLFCGLKKMEYAVRGTVAVLADKIDAELQTAAGQAKYPFDSILKTNIGNPHALGAVEPLAWPRQVMALVDLPNALGVDHPEACKMFPEDAIARAKKMKEQLEGHGSGAYTHSKGVLGFRKDVADFISQRDGGIPAHPEDIFLTNGASSAIDMILNAVIANPSTGVMIPIPQYPIYSATIELLQGQCVGYRLDEKNGWKLNAAELKRAHQGAISRGIDVRALVVINPGNPCGTVLTRENLHDVVTFCHEQNLVILADEVYQENVYSDNHQFISCKLAAHEMGLIDDKGNGTKTCAPLELVSFHSTSKGVFGECGRRGGYMELVGLDAAVKDQLYKLVACASLCGTNGQIMTSLMCRGPSPGDVSYSKHMREKQSNLKSLKHRAQMVSRGLNDIPGFSCHDATGAMYCYPKFELPAKAIRAAKEEGLSPDTFYAVSLLKQTGICVVPASGFELKHHQKDGDESTNFGFRITFLLSDEEMALVVDRIRRHYQDFCLSYQ